jgi:Kef-type K+ transport system membrane component KefB
VLGEIIVPSIFSQAALERLGLPDLLGYLLIGVGLNLVHDAWPQALPADARLLTLLAQIGVVALLFRIGLEREIEHLWRRLSGATWIWLVNATASLLAVLGAALFLLDWALLPSLFGSVALTATGIGVSVRVWRNSDQLGSAEEALMLDVAEMDDLFGVVLLALLTALAPDLQHGWSACRWRCG